jgi:hypothetical protein
MCVKILVIKFVNIKKNCNFVALNLGTKRKLHGRYTLLFKGFRKE